jgi:hypothetical protein
MTLFWYVAFVSHAAQHAIEKEFLDHASEAAADHAAAPESNGLP